MGGVVYLSFSKLWIRLQIDDPLDAAPLHMGSGMWGVLSVGLFARRHFIEETYGRETDAWGLFYGVRAPATRPLPDSVCLCLMCTTSRSLLGTLVPSRTPQHAFMCVHRAASASSWSS